MDRYFLWLFTICTIVFVIYIIHSLAAINFKLNIIMKHFDVKEDGEDKENSPIGEP